MKSVSFEDVLEEVLLTIPPAPYLFKEDLAERWGMSEKTIDSKCSKAPGDLPFFTKIGESSNSKILFPRKSVAEFEARRIWQAQQRRKPSSTPDCHLASSDDLLNLL